MYKNFGIFIFIIALPFILVSISGCASIYGTSTYSIITPSVQSSAPDTNNVDIKISANAWGGKPSNLSGYLTPLFIEITNNTQKPIAVRYEDFVIIDKSRNQYNAVIPEIASDIVEQKSRKKWYFRPSISIGIGSGGYYRRGYGYGGSVGFYNRGYPFYRGYPYYSSPFYWPYNSAYYADYYNSYYYNQDYSDLFTNAFVPGVIRPNAKLSGFVYFKKLPSSVTNFTLDVGYKIEGENKRYDLTFPYEVVLYRN